MNGRNHFCPATHHQHRSGSPPEERAGSTIDNSDVPVVLERSIMDRRHRPGPATTAGVVSMPAPGRGRRVGWSIGFHTYVLANPVDAGRRDGHVSARDRRADRNLRAADEPLQHRRERRLPQTCEREYRRRRASPTRRSSWSARCMIQRRLLEGSEHQCSCLGRHVTFWAVNVPVSIPPRIS